MATDVTVYLPDQPGELARIGKVLGDHGVNIDGFCAMRRGGETELHILVDDAESTMKALATENIDVVSEQEVVVVDLEESDRPGALGDMASRLGASGVNISLAYLATETRLVFGADDLAAARRALG
ncbi:MAG: ACT domain-containing protein [Acidimicrobiales bacterium]